MRKPLYTGQNLHLTLLDMITVVVRCTWGKLGESMGMHCVCFAHRQPHPLLCVQLEALTGIQAALVAIFVFCWLYVESVDPAEEVCCCLTCRRTLS